MSCCFRTSVEILGKSVEEKPCWESVSTRRKEPGERLCWLERDAWRSRRCYVKEVAFWNEDFEKAEWAKRKMSLLTLRWPRVQAIGEMQRKRFSRRRREAGFEEEGQERNESG